MKLDGVSSMCHYLDDMFTCGHTNTSECRDNLDVMINACDECGVELNPRNMVLPTTCIEFL
jgi:hypothetical protein